MTARTVEYDARGRVPVEGRAPDPERVAHLPIRLACDTCENWFEIDRIARTECVSCTSIGSDVVALSRDDLRVIVVALSSRVLALSSGPDEPDTAARTRAVRERVMELLEMKDEIRARVKGGAS